MAGQVSKYLANVVEEVRPGWRAPGRWCRRFNRKKFKREMERIEVSATAARRLRRLGARKISPDRRAQLDYLSLRNAGLSVFGPDAVFRSAVAWAQQPS
jgi:hypothetical protein